MIAALGGINAHAGHEAEDTGTPRVVFFYGGNAATDSWTRTIIEIADVAAVDLGVEFEVVYSDPGRKELFESVSRRIETGAPLDYALVVNYRSGAEHILSYLDEQGVKSFLFNADLTEEAKEKIGAPREKLVHWIGSLVPDDEQAGYDLAIELIEAARDKTDHRPIRLLALSGSYANTAAIERVKGLRRAVSENPDVELLQVVNARWIPQLAAEKYVLLKNRYPEIDAVWVANDMMALSVRDAMNAVGDGEVVLGGMDWTEDALRALHDGRITASMGGHTFDIAYVLAILKQYHRGCDYATSAQDASLRSILTPMTGAEEPFEDVVEDKNWKSLDFAAIDCDFLQQEGFEAISFETFHALAGKVEG